MLRNMALVGQTAHVTMPAHQKYVFEEGVNLIFSRWTALQLAVANEWGGSTSRQKAQELLEDVIQWFYTSKGTVLYFDSALCYTFDHKRTVDR